MSESLNPYAIPSAKLINDATVPKDHAWLAGVVFALPFWAFAVFGFTHEVRKYKRPGSDELLGFFVAIAVAVSGSLIYKFPIYWKSIHGYSVLRKIFGFIVFPVLVDLIFWSIPIGYVNYKAQQKNSHYQVGIPTQALKSILIIIFFHMLYQLIQLLVLHLLVKRWSKRTGLTWA